MNDGLYSVSFLGPHGTGSGVAVIERGRIHGGDGAYYYVGGFQVLDDRAIAAILHVGRHSNRADSVVGPISAFRVEVDGTHGPETFSVSGSVAGQRDVKIQIHGRKIANLDTAPL